MSRLNAEYKTFSFKAEEVEENGIIKGYASVFGNTDLGLDIVKKGAFKDSLKEDDGVVPILFQHNDDEQLGWNRKAKEDDYGLWVEGELNLKVKRAYERHELAKQALKIGAPSGLSIGYFTIAASPDTKNPRIRILEKVKMFEYSMVTFPMNTSALIEDAKSLGVSAKVQLILQECKRQGISNKDLLLALNEQGKNVDYDVTKIGAAIDRLTENIKSVTK